MADAAATSVTETDWEAVPESGEDSPSPPLRPNQE